MSRADADQIWDLIHEATVDCYGPEEQVTGLPAMLEEHLELPFSTVVLGVPVLVDSVDLDDLPKPPLGGSEWIAAYCHWAQQNA